MKVCEDAGMDVVIVDSISHEWEGEGGILDTHAQMVGNSFTNWSKLTPRHNALVQKILASGKHVIVTVRSKQEYVLSEKNGKNVPEKVGMKGVQRDGLEYDFTLVFELDINHNVTCTKDRTNLFSQKVSFKADSNVGVKIREWCKTAEPMEEKEVLKLINACLSTEELHDLYKHNPGVRNYNMLFNYRSLQLRTEREEKNQLKSIRNGQVIEHQ